MLASLPSSSSSSMTSSPRLPHLHSFVKLSTKSSTRALAPRRRRHSLSSSCSTASNGSDESDAFDLEADDCSLLYESYAAVTKRSSHSICWRDLQRAQPLHALDAYRTPAPARRQQPRRLELSGPLTGTSLELCFAFLTLEELLESVVYVCVAFHDVVAQSETLFIRLYSRQWRANKMLPQPYVTLCYRDQLLLCSARRAGALYELSTRSAVTLLANGTYDVVNNSMLRSFANGSIDSIRGLTKLPLLACARVLHKKLVYYEVKVQGCGSVGLVSISDAAARAAYGFGSREHVGWKSLSYGYHSNDGAFVFNDGAKVYGGERRAFGPVWGRATMDLLKQDSSSVATVGCGLDAGKCQVFFTLDGKLIGTAPVMVLPGDYAAAVSLHAFGDRAVINAGAAPFVFDIEAFCASP